MESTPKKHFFPRSLWLILFILLALVAGTFAIVKTVLHKRVEARLDQIRAAKQPVTSVDVNAWMSFVPAADNAALAVLEASRYIVTNAPAMNHGTWGQNELSQDQIETLSRILSLNSNAFDHLSQALKQPGSRYPVDWSPGPGALLPHLAKIQTLANLLEAKARLAAMQSNPVLSAEAIQEIIALSQTLKTEPAMISQLVRLSEISRAVSDLELLLNHSTLSVAQTQKLRAAFESIEQGSSEAILRALLAERAMGVYIFQTDPAQLGGILDNSFKSSGASTAFNPLIFYKISPLFDADFLHYLGITAMEIQAAQLPFPQALDASAKIQAHATTTHSAFHLISNLCLPDNEQFMNKYAYRMARCALAIAALGIEEYRSTHNGAYPQSSTDLKFPKDPFSGQPLVYAVREDGYLIYSIGPDRKDDDGQPIQTSHSRKKNIETRQDDFAATPGDLTFTVSH